MSPLHKEVRRLYNLKINFVSMCPVGANPGAKIRITKEQIMDPAKKENEVTVDLTALSADVVKAVTESLKPITEAKNATPEAIAAAMEAATATIDKSIADVKTGLETQLKKQMSEIEAAIKKNYEEKAIKKQADNDDEILVMKGQEFRKSAMGDVAFAAMKEVVANQLAMQKELDVEKARLRVEKEYPHIAGDPEQKAHLLMHIEAHPDKAVQEFGKALIKALNDSGEKLAKESGSSENQSTDTGASAAEKKLDELAKEIAKRDGISYFSAYAKAAATPEGLALAKEYNEGAKA